jgi:hypothetical protein
MMVQPADDLCGREKEKDRKENNKMLESVRAIWIMARVMIHSRIQPDEEGSVVEKVILTAIFAALALAVGAIIVAKITAKANSINLN